MRQRMTPSFWHIGAAVALALAVLVALGPGAALAKDHPQISLSPSKGDVNIQITITGKSFPAFCAGVIFIDNRPTDTLYNCDSNGAFQAQLTWPDGLDDGKHTINARGLASSAQATFTQSNGTPTPDATATARAGQATATAAAVQSTATASAPTATKITAAAGAGNATPPTGGASISPAVLTMILVASVLLIAGGVLLALALSNRRQALSGLPAHAYRPVPPPPPPSNATLPQGEDWVWPNDPYRR